MSVLTDSSLFTEKQLQWNAIYAYSYTSYTTFEQCLPHAFRRLCSPDVSEEFLYTWIKGLRELLAKAYMDTNGLTSSRVSRFIGQCLTAGIVGTMVHLSTLRAKEQNRETYMAISVIGLICRCANDSQNLILVQELISKGGFDVFVKCLRSSPRPVEKGLAGSCLEILLTQTHLAEELTAAQIADLLVAATAFTLQDHKDLVHDLEKPENSYMRENLRYTEDTCQHGINHEHGECGGTQFLTETVQLAPRWFADIQECTIRGSIYAICRRKCITQEECLNIIKQEPEIIDNLLLTVSNQQSRTKCDGAAALILCFLMTLPPDLAVTDDPPAEMEYAIRCNETLFRRPQALQLLVRARTNAIPPDPTIFIELICEGWRGKGDEVIAEDQTRLSKGIIIAGEVGISTLRILMNIALLPETSPSILLALLPIAYVACAKVPTESECNAAAKQGPGSKFGLELLRQGRHIHEVRLGSSIDGPDTGQIQLYIPPETMVGPTLFFRILHRLTTEGYTLDRLRQMKEMPFDTPTVDAFPTPLVHIHQIVEPKVIGKLIRMSVYRRIPIRRELGSRRLASAPDLARLTYQSATQLAQAISHFGMHPSNASARGVKENMKSIKQAYMEMVLCTGNSCEAAVRTKDWSAAATYAQHAVDLCDKCLPEDAAEIGWDLVSSRQKNARRLAKVSVELKEPIVLGY